MITGRRGLGKGPQAAPLWDAAAAAAAVWLTLAVRICRNLDTSAGAEEILRYLREHFEEIEG